MQVRKIITKSASDAQIYSLDKPLPTCLAEHIELATKLANAIKADWQKGRDLYARLKLKPARLLTRASTQESQGHPAHIRKLVVEAKRDTLVGISLRVDKPRATLGQFRHHFKLALTSLQVKNLYPKSPEYAQVLSLTALLCTKCKINPSGFLAARPFGIFRLDQPDWSLEVAPYFKHVLTGFLKIKTPQDILNKPAVSKALKNVGLTEVLRLHSFSDLLEIAWPGLIKGSAAVIHPWQIQRREKFLGHETEDMTDMALRWGAKEANLISNGPQGETLNRDQIADTDWSLKFREIGLGSIVTNLGDSRRALWRALALHGYADQLGPGPDRVLPHRIGTLHSWCGPDGQSLIECVAIDIVEHRLRKKHPKYFANDGKGSPIPEELKKVTNWHRLFAEVSPAALKQRRISAEDALRYTYPELFGEAPHRLRHEHFIMSGKWEVPAAKEIFGKAVLHGLVAHGLGRYDLHPLTRQFSVVIDAAAVSKWDDNRSAEQSDSSWLIDFLGSTKLHGGAKKLFGLTPSKIIEATLKLGNRTPPKDLNTKCDRWLSKCFLGSEKRQFMGVLGILSKREADEFLGTAPKHAPKALSDFRRNWFWVPAIEIIPRLPVLSNAHEELKD